MGAFSRIRYVLAANMNTLLERAENPEKIVRALIREMEETREETRAALAELMAEGRTSPRPLAASGQAIQQWTEKATQAVRDENHDLARRALAEKLTAEKRAELARAFTDQNSTQLAQLESNFEILNTKIDEARALLMNINAKPAASKNEPIMRNQSRAEPKLYRALGRFGALEAKVEGIEARVRSYEFGRQQRPGWRHLNSVSDESSEAELDVLKQRVLTPLAAASS